MGFIFDPERKAEAQERLQADHVGGAADAWNTPCRSPWSRWSTTSPSTSAARSPRCCRARTRRCRPPYYAMTVPALLRLDPRRLPAGAARGTGRLRRRLPHPPGTGRHGADPLRPPAAAHRARRRADGDLHALLASQRLRPGAARADPRGSARTGASAWRRTACRSAATIEDVQPGDVFDAVHGLTPEMTDAGPGGAGRRAGGRGHAGGGRRQPLDAGRGRGQGAASVRQAGRQAPHVRRDAPGEEPPHRPAVRASPAPHLHDQLPDARADRRTILQAEGNYGYAGPLLLSPGRAIGLRMVPTVRDLRFAWEEMPQQRLDAQAQKVRDSGRAALIGWAQRGGRGERLHGQPAVAVPAPGRPLVRSPEHAPQRRAGSCWTSSRSCNT